MSFKCKTILTMATALMAESKCAKHKVASMLVKGNEILSTGVNGTEHGEPNCCDVWADKRVHVEPARTEHREWAAIHERHAEDNMFRRAACLYHIVPKDTTVVVSRSPCANCSQKLIRNGVNHVMIICDGAPLCIDPELKKHIPTISLWEGDGNNFIPIGLIINGNFSEVSDDLFWEMQNSDHDKIGV